MLLMISGVSPRTLIRVLVEVAANCTCDKQVNCQVRVRVLVTFRCLVTSIAQVCSLVLVIVHRVTRHLLIDVCDVISVYVCPHLVITYVLPGRGVFSFVQSCSVDVTVTVVSQPRTKLQSRRRYTVVCRQVAHRDVKFLAIDMRFIKLQNHLENVHMYDYLLRA